MSSNEVEKRQSDLSALKPREENGKRFNFAGINPGKRVNFACINPRQSNISEFPALKDCLPDSYEYHVCDYETISETSDHVNYRATLRMALSTEDEIKLWLKSHTVTWRVERTYPGKGQRILFKVVFRCQHNTKPRSSENVAGRRSKNTNCPAKMTVTLLRTQVSRGRQSLSTDLHVPTFPTIVSICADHNHNIYVADAVADLDITNDTWQEETDVVMVAEEVQQAGSEEVSHQAAAAGFAEMCQKLSAMVNSNASFTASSVAAVEAFNRMQDNPSKIMTALHKFGRYTNTGLASMFSHPENEHGEWGQ